MNILILSQHTMVNEYNRLYPCGINRFIYSIAFAVNRLGSMVVVMLAYQYEHQHSNTLTYH